MITTLMIPILTDSLHQIFRAIDTLRVLVDQPTSKLFPIEILSMVIALLAVIFGPFVQFRIARKQITAQIEIATNKIKSSVLSNNRQQWINTLRDTVSEFTSVVLSLYGMLFAQGVPKKDERILMKFERVQFLISKTKLLINPTEVDHQNLVALMDSIIDAFVKDNKKEISSKTNELIPSAQKILKNEWNRVKKLE